MSIKFRIPRYGGAGPALFGVQFKDTYILILSLLIAAVAGKFYGTPAYLGIPFAGYHINKKYIEWCNERLEGFARVALFRLGLKGYGRFKSQKTLYIGDATVINPRNRHLIESILDPSSKEKGKLE
ncbi:hypothetical protein KTE60_15965 [Burkholderia multivorans]|uniref:Uncharacterized protein n=1 Tax=Burkholderia multivorans TaxID=87883 RepID=A0A2S9MUA4_9BURK|nr:hypothetical protein [Burkholderia multivorans]ELK7722789.1 hypothetical protein [Burkholderia cenocepacia]ABX19883.1 hypothetical protein Bmul_6230 [Burkholderia multivorans ATCC 17616]MBN6738783.1 hypothetical protein [Burkholderia multivorans]MBN7130293.1 hypothetical protein [Burkholderia multivorans]MBN8173418.1 hypothetical protein [Burkholderia multivorans]